MRHERRGFYPVALAPSTPSSERAGPSTTSWPAPPATWQPVWSLSTDCSLAPHSSPHPIPVLDDQRRDRVTRPIGPKTCCRPRHRDGKLFSHRIDVSTCRRAPGSPDRARSCLEGHVNRGLRVTCLQPVGTRVNPEFSSSAGSAVVRSRLAGYAYRCGDRDQPVGVSLGRVRSWWCLSTGRAGPESHVRRVRPGRCRSVTSCRRRAAGYTGVQRIYDWTPLRGMVTMPASVTAHEVQDGFNPRLWSPATAGVNCHFVIALRAASVSSIRHRLPRRHSEMSQRLALRVASEDGSTHALPIG